MAAALGGVARKFNQDQWNAIEKVVSPFEQRAQGVNLYFGDPETLLKRAFCIGLLRLLHMKTS